MSNPDLDSIRHSKTELENQVAKLQQRVRELEDLANVNESREQTAQRFDLALWATNSSLWDWDVQRNLFWSSPGNQLLYGRGDDEITEPFDIEDDADPWPQHLHPDDRESTLQHLRNHLAEDKALDVEYRYRMPDGKYRWIRSIGRAVRAPDGTPLRVVGSSTDITKRRRAQDEAERFREAVDNASEGFVLYDRNERFVFANKRYRKMYPEVGHLLNPGEQRETIRQDYIATGAMPNAVGRADEFMKESNQQQKSPGSFELQLANGAWIKYSDHVLADGGMVCVRTDITDIKQHDAYYQALFDSETVGVTITRADGSYVATNSVYQRMLGYSGAELLTMRWQDVSHADEVGRINFDIHAMRAGTGSGLIFEKRFVPKDGGIVWARLNMALIDDDSSDAPLQFALVENITQQVEAEQALRDSELRFRTIFEDAAIGIASVRKDGVMLQCNPAWSNMLGYERGELDGKHWSVFTHADDIAENKRQSDRLLSGEITSFQLEKRFIRKDGGVLWGRLTVSLVGKIIEHARFRIAMIEDITERKNAESALRESEQNLRDSEQKLRRIFESAAVGIATNNLQGRYIETNPAYQKMLGRSEDELRETTYQALTHPDDGVVEASASTDLLGGQTDTFQMNKRYFHKDGSTIWVNIHSSPLKDAAGATIGSIAIVEDITERKHFEDELKVSEARLAESQRIAGLGNWVWDIVTDDIVWSDGIYRIFGRTSKEFGGNDRAFFDAVHPEDRAQVKEAVRRTLEEGEPYSIDYRVVWPDGSVHAMYERGELTTDEVGKPLRMSGTTQDITARKQIEDQLLQAQKMEAVGQLTGGVAHDFNNLLAVMMGNLELIGSRVDSDGAVSEMVERGVKAAERGAALTHRLLAFSRKQTLLPTTIDLNLLVADMSDMLRRTLGETIDVVTVETENLWLCVADQPQLENALLNLSINARDAMPRGGRLKIETANISLPDEVAAKQADVDPGDYVVLIVSDTGCGIAEDTLGHVFEPFFTTKDVGKGSGLGLSMVYGFAKQSGGAAVITSTLGDGTEIKLYLPVRAGHGDEIADNQSIAEIPRSQGERVLVVEDDDEVRALAVSFLSDLGYDTAEADSAQTALEMLENAGAIDLVLSDVVLPGAMNGPDLMAELRRRIPAIKIIYMTGYAERTFNHPGGLESGTRLIRKPFKKTDFANAIRQTLDEV